MFGIALGTIVGYAAATGAGGVVGAWLHAKFLQVKAAAKAEETAIEARLKALEAKLTGATTPPPAA